MIRDYGYKHNEWVALYLDENGDTQALTFDTFEQATEFMQSVFCKIGIVTTVSYNAYLAKHHEEKEYIIF